MRRRTVSLLCILLFILCSILAANDDSVTVDEFVHLPLGMYILHTGDVSLDPINPPLGKVLLALPQIMLATKAPTDPAQGGWGLGYEFMEKNFPRYHETYILSRYAAIFLATALLWLVGWWSYKLFGGLSGASAIFLLATCPTFIAHAHLVTLDVPGSLGFISSLYFLWILDSNPTLKNAMIFGVVFGLALLVKLSSLALLPVIVVYILFIKRRNIVSWPRIAGILLISSAITILTINLGYGFSGTAAPISLGNFFKDGLLDYLGEKFPQLRLPLPLIFVEGIDRILEEGKHIEGQSYLFGEMSTQGWWYYHLVAFAAKTPIPFLLLSALALTRTIRARSFDGSLLLIALGLLFCANIFGNSQQIGVRHVISAYPILAILCSPLLASGLETLLNNARKWTIASFAATAVCLGCLSSTLLTCSKYLQYFNIAFGGDEYGHNVLIDSNLDWGQDLIRLRHYMLVHSLKHINLAYFGRVDPRVYGISFSPLEKETTGIAAVSATFLMGRSYVWFLQGELAWLPPNHYRFLHGKRPIARVGSLFIFKL